MNKVLHSDKFIFLSAVMVSLFLSWWLSTHDNIVNPDAICYLLSAKEMSQTGFLGGMRLCGQAQWPFYPFFIHLLASLSFLSTLQSAYFLDAIFSAMTVVFFLAIIKKFSPSKKILWLAALTILGAHEFNSVKQYIIRDHGFWAFYLASFYFLLRYFETAKFSEALAWSLCLGLASLFRIEGAVFLLFLPFLSFFNSSWKLKHKIQAYFSLNVISIAGALCIFAYLLMHGSLASSKLGRFSEITQHLQHGLGMLVERRQSLQANLVEHFLNSDSAKQASTVLILLMVSWYSVSVIFNLSVIYTALGLYAWKQKLMGLKPSQRLVLMGYIALNVLITFSFLMERLFLSKRYLIALSLLLMLAVPFALNYLWDQRLCFKRQLSMIVIASVVLYSAAGGIFNFGYSKRYISDAGAWIAENIPKNAILYANDYQLMYYSQHFGNQIFDKIKYFSQIENIDNQQWKHYDYLALRVDKHNKKNITLLNELPVPPIRVFQNKRGDQISIYKIAEKS